MHFINLVLDISFGFYKEKTQYVINTLKTDYREIMILKLFLEMKDHEIADYLSLNTSTVKTKIHRARKQLKAAF
ncbi:sigma factor-like helix-turn-helix DNA-binding protein [Priestia megaterium]|uniref:RNA polymerase sigma factor n=1 Tax=Priestia megaterium TaxID=1404 RepID=UPI0030EF1324